MAALLARTTSRLAVLSISPGNTWFKEGNIRTALQHIQRDASQRTALVTPGTLFEHTLRAAGTKNPVVRARDSTRRVLRECRQAMMEEGDHGVTAVPVLSLADTFVSFHPEYQRELACVHDTYSSSGKFRREVEEGVTQAVHSVQIRGRNIQKPPALTASKVDEGAQYLLKEIAGFCALPTMLSVGTVDIWYPNEFKICNDYFQGKFQNAGCEAVRMRILPGGLE